MPQILRHDLGAIIARVVEDDRDLLCGGIGICNLLQQNDGGDRIDGLIEANLCRHRLNVDGTVDVQPLTTRNALEMHGRAELDLPATQHRIV